MLFLVINFLDILHLSIKQLLIFSASYICQLTLNHHVEHAFTACSFYFRVKFSTSKLFLHLFDLPAGIRSWQYTSVTCSVNRHFTFPGNCLVLQEPLSKRVFSEEGALGHFNCFYSWWTIQHQDFIAHLLLIITSYS